MDISAQALSALLAEPHKRPLFINAKNENDGWADSLSQAWSSGRSFAVPIRAGVIPLDLDNDEDITAGERLIGLLAHNDAVEFLEATSGTPEHRHLYLIATTPNSSEWLATELDRFTRKAIRAKQQMRPPGAPHRCHPDTASAVVHLSGGFIDALRRLSVGSPVAEKHKPPVVLRLPWRLPDVALPADLESAVRSGSAHERHGGRRHAWEMSLIRKLNLAGAPRDQIIKLALDPLNSFGEKARALRGETGLRYLDQSINRSVDWHLASPVITCREDAVAVLVDYRRLVEHAGPGYIDHTERCVLLGVIELLMKCGGVRGSYHLSCRDVAAASGRTHDTAAKSLRRLVSDGWLVKTKTAEFEKRLATEYALCCSRFRTLIGALGGLPLRVSCSSNPPIGHPAFGYRDLGSTAHLVYCHLDHQHAMTNKVIAQRTGLPPSTVSKRLKDLELFEAVTQDTDGYRKVNDVDWDRAATAMGADVRQRTRNNRFDLDRRALGVMELSELGLSSEYSAFDSRFSVNRRTGEKVLICELSPEQLPP